MNRRLGSAARLRVNVVRAVWLAGLLVIGLVLTSCFAVRAVADGLESRLQPAEAGTPTTDGQHRVATYRSRHFQLHTDLPGSEAQSLLRRMEATLRMIAKYWRRPLQGRVVCFVAHDLSNWSDESLRHSQARVLLEHVRGGTQILERDGRSTKSSAHVYATSNRGVAEHELVHAYCHLTFGTCGPEWYKEGMADVAARSGRGGGAVNCPPEVVRLLRQERGKSIRDIVIARRFTEPIADRMDEIHEAQSTGDLAKNQWLAADDEIVAKARQSYDWSWSLCHFLCNNPNYRDRFRMLGMGYLSQSDVSFQQLFGPVADQLIFEYDLFLRDVDNGYRVDLCGWDWQQEFLELEATETISSLVKACWGYQPSRLLVSAGQEYDYNAVGSWTTGAGRRETSADGDDNGRGRLIGVILQGYSLGEPFELGAAGSFVARNGGRLYLRCGDAWQELGDNAGRVTIRWQKKQRGSLESQLQPAEAGTDRGGP